MLVLWLRGKCWGLQMSNVAVARILEVVVAIVVFFVVARVVVVRVEIAGVVVAKVVVARVVVVVVAVMYEMRVAGVVAGIGVAAGVVVGVVVGMHKAVRIGEKLKAAVVDRVGIGDEPQDVVVGKC